MQDGKPQLPFANRLAIEVTEQFLFRFEGEFRKLPVTHIAVFYVEGILKLLEDDRHLEVGIVADDRKIEQAIAQGRFGSDVSIRPSVGPTTYSIAISIICR